jgi:hypothetical protein
MSSDSLNLRYFSPESVTEDVGVHFSFAYDYTLASYEAIWDSVRGCRSRRYADEGVDASLMGFTPSLSRATSTSEAWSWCRATKMRPRLLLCRLRSSSASSRPGMRSLKARTPTPTREMCHRRVETATAPTAYGEGGEVVSSAATLRTGRAVKQVDYTGQGA